MVPIHPRFRIQSGSRSARATSRVGVAVLLALVLTLLTPRPGSAHIVKETPWHPVPAAYLRGLFLANLGPAIRWDRIDDEWSQPAEGEGYDGLSPLDMLEEADVDAEPIRAAIRDEDRQALYAASTAAVSRYARHFLAEATAKLDRPGAANADVQRARQITRAFEDPFIAAVDPRAAQDLGRAWLTLSNSVGHSGVMGIGRLDARPEPFAQAKGTVETYLRSNYEVSAFETRRLLAPLPERSPTRDLEAEAPFWLPPGTKFNDQDPLPLLVLNFESRGIHEADLPLIAYGDMLFDSPQIFGDPGKSLGITCSKCHNRSDINRDLFIPGVSHKPGSIDVDGAFFNSAFNDIRDDPIDIPSLRGLRFTGPYGRDGRFASLREFTRNVIVNEFGGEEPTPFMLDALVSYMLEFDWLENSMLEPDGRLNDAAPKAALRGEVLFNTPFEGMGDRACSTCHIPSANFLDRLPHDIGSAERSSPLARDSFFDTPTLINVAQTAPYFHDGSLDTLADVVTWFDEQFALELTQAQRADLTAYLETIGAADTPWEIFDDENTRFALDWSELSTFLTTLDVLIEERDQFHALLLLDTVAPDLRLDASGATDATVLPRVFEIADALDGIRARIEAEEWVVAEEQNERYQELAETYGESFR